MTLSSFLWGVVEGLLATGIYDGGQRILRLLLKRSISNNRKEVVRHLIKIADTARPSIYVTVCTFIAYPLVPRVFIYYLLLFILSAIVITLLQGRRYKQYARNKSRSTEVLTSMYFVPMVMLTFIGYFLFSSVEARRTAIFVVDASGDMQGLFANVKPQINEVLAGVPDNFDLGLIVFGSGISRSVGCGDITQLVDIAPKEINLPKIAGKLDLLSAGLPPHGTGDLRGSVFRAIDDLVGRSGPQEIYVITSGVDSGCGQLDRPEVQRYAKQKGVTFQLAIAALGSQTERNEKILKAYADVGRYIAVPNEAELPEALGRQFNSPKFSTYELLYGMSYGMSR